MMKENGNDSTFAWHAAKRQMAFFFSFFFFSFKKIDVAFISHRSKYFGANEMRDMLDTANTIS